MSLSDFVNMDKWDGPYREVECRKALHPSGLPDIDYALNPYAGCEHGCIYCYAPELTHADWSEWRVVRVKQNIADRLSKEIGGLEGVIGIGTVTDPYQPAERRFELTLSCLQVIERSEMSVHIHTKSDLIQRDMELIGSMKHVIGLTVTTPDERVSKITEPGAPLPDVRFDNMRTLVEAGMNVYALVGPVMSSLTGKEEEFCSRIARTGVKTAYIDRLNLRPKLKERLERMHIVPSPPTVEKVRSILTSYGIDVHDVF